VWLLSPLCPWPKVELVVVMVIVPLILNTLYFWAIDNVLKRKPQVPPQYHVQPNQASVIFCSLGWQRCSAFASPSGFQTNSPFLFPTARLQPSPRQRSR
jgi:hypothetical protein